MILRILPVLLLTCLLPDIYIYYWHLRKPIIPRWAKVTFWGPTALLLFFAVWLTYTESLTPENMDAIVLYFSAYMLLALPKTTYTLVSLIGKLIGLILPPYRKANTPISFTAGFAVFCMMICGLSFGPTLLKVRKTVFQSETLPKKFDGYKIVQISDLHLTSMKTHPEFISELVRTINAQQADAICFTGDLVSTDVTELYPFVDELSKLKAKDGVFSILGNHDYMTYAKYMTPLEKSQKFHEMLDLQEKMGWNLLQNEHSVIHRGQDSIVILGVENDGKPPFPERGDLNKALKGINQNTSVFKLLLSHDPSHWKRKVLPVTDIQLTLSGHTHGMQFMIGNWSPAQYLYPEWKGMYQENSRGLYVSLGVGGALIPFRFGAWPEINVITLHCK